VSAARKPLVGVWRDAVRDSGLDSAAKLVAHTLSTYMNGGGRAFPAQTTIAAGCSYSDRAVQGAIYRIERAGFLSIERSRSRRGHRYTATLPLTANEVRHSEWETANEVRSSAELTANETTSNGEPHARNGERGSDESVESVSESVTSTRARARGKKRHALRAVSNTDDLSGYDV
jgi:hypothetical protein